METTDTWNGGLAMKTLKTLAAATMYGVLVVFAGPMLADMWTEEVFGLK